MTITRQQLRFQVTKADARFVREGTSFFSGRRHFAPSVLVLVALFASTTAWTGCGEDNVQTVAAPAPTPTLPPLGSSPPEQLLIDMAFGTLTGVSGDYVYALLFPSPSIDYQTLTNDFLAATKQALAQNTITEQDGDVNGEMANLNESNEDLNANPPPTPYGPPPPTPYTADEARQAYVADVNHAGYAKTIDDIWNAVTVQQSPVNSTLAVLEQYDPSQSLAGWMAGAQVKIGFLELESQLNAIRNPSDLGPQSVLATDLGSPSGDDLIEYAVDTRNKVLYSNLTASVAKVTGCVEYYEPYSATPDLWEYNDCSGALHNGYTSASACTTARVKSVLACANNIYSQQSPPLGWIDQVVNQWRELLTGLADLISPAAQPCAICEDADGYITVDTAGVTLSGYSGSQAVTSWLQAACNGKQTCDYQLKASNFGQSGSTFSGFTITYSCGSPSDNQYRYLGITNNTATDGGQTLHESGLRATEGAYVHLDCAPRIANIQQTYAGSAPTANPAAACGPEYGRHSCALAITDPSTWNVSWSCGSSAARYTATQVPWNQGAVLQMTCPGSDVTCVPGQATTCSTFKADAPDAVVYENVSIFPYSICPSQYPNNCVGVIKGKTNFYHSYSSTMNDPACDNVQQAIYDAIAEGSCPPGINTSVPTTSWPYGHDIGAGATSTCLPSPADQPAFLPAVGCLSFGG